MTIISTASFSHHSKVLTLVRCALPRSRPGPGARRHLESRSSAEMMTGSQEERYKGQGAAVDEPTSEQRAAGALVGEAVRERG